MPSSYSNRLGTAPEEAVKAPCVVAAVTNITLSGEQTIGVTAVVAGDRVLVAGQTDSTENGIYDAAAGAWSRATDWNAPEDVISGQLVAVPLKLYQASFTGTYNPNVTEVSFSELGVSTGYTQQTFVATAGQTLFTLSNTYTQGIGALAVYINGVFQDPSAFTETSTTSFTLSEGLDAGDLVTTVVSSFTTLADSISSSLVTYDPGLTGAVISNAQTKLRERVTVRDFGAVGDGVTDDYLALQAAIDAMQGVGILWLTPGEFLTSQTLNITSPIVILGEGGQDNDGISDIVGDNTDGPVIRVKTPHYVFRDFTVTASNTRRVATRIIGSNYAGLGKTRDDQNYGIWVEMDDSPTQEIGDGYMENIWVHNQPNDGIVMVGRIYGSHLLKCGVRDSIGHGFVINCGDETGRTNVDAPGVMKIETGQVYGCTGHALAVGSEDVSQMAVRCVIDNFDAYNCCSDDTITYNDSSGNPYVIHYHCDNGVIRDSAVNGTTDTIGGMRVAGRNSRLINNRYLDTIQPVYIDRLQLSGVDRLSEGIEVDGLYTTQDTALVHTVAVAIHSTSISCVVRALTVEGNFTNAATPGTAAIEVQKGDDRTWEGTLAVDQSVTALQLYSGNVTVADDAVATINTRTNGGFLSVTTNATTGFPLGTMRALVYYDTGTTPELVSINAGAATTVTSADVTGTTGTDTEITLGVVAGSVKIENRTGASVVFTYAFLG